MAIFALYQKLSKEEIDKIYKKTLIDISTWFEQHPRRRVCNIEWIYGKTCKIRRKFIKEDLGKMYKQTILETFMS